MKKTFTLIIFTLFTLQVQAQLSGSYTIGNFAADYPTIQTAIDDLNNLGISANVIFNVQNGSYNEQVTIIDFPRTVSATAATVTFKKMAY